MVNRSRWEQMEALFEEAMALDPGARTEFLTRACDGDAELRREVEAMIAACEPDRALAIERLAPAASNEVDAMVGGELGPLPEEHRLLVSEGFGDQTLGKRVDSYQIIRLLGRGGMGTVYEAIHAEVGRKVALKVLHPELAGDEQMLMRFLNEARAANAIGHSGIVEVHHCGRLSSGVPYIVMELLPGESLRERLRRKGRARSGPAVDIVCQAAAALGAAHACGIVHRDLKPDNVFLLPDTDKPESTRVKILDFGIAKLTQSQHGGGPVRTRTGAVMGTPAYMSPEQCRGIREVDHRTDIYALGIILYEMLCGAAPFVSPGEGEVLFRQIAEQPRHPQRRNRDVSDALAEAILKALAKDPDHRFQSMVELQQALQAALVQTDRSARGRGVLLFGGGTAVSLALAAMLSFRQPDSWPPQRAVASRAVVTPRTPPPVTAAIRGRLVDDQTGIPLVGARVFSHRGDRPGVATDENGFFLIPNLQAGSPFWLAVVRDRQTEALEVGRLPEGQALVDLGTRRLVSIDWTGVNLCPRGWIGLRHEMRDGKMIVTGLHIGDTAEQAGIKAGDRILSIDGKSVDDLSHESRSSYLDGRPGTEVAVTIESPSGQTTTRLLRRRLDPARAQCGDFQVQRPAHDATQARKPVEKPTKR